MPLSNRSGIDPKVSYGDDPRVDVSARHDDYLAKQEPHGSS